MDLLRTTISQAFTVFVELNWQVTLLAVVIGRAALASRKTSSNFRYWLWCILLVRLCLPFNLSLPYGLGDDLRTMLLSIPDHLSTVETVTTAPEAGDPALFQMSLPMPPAPVMNPESMLAPVVPVETVVTVAPPLSWAEIIMLSWGGCVLLLTMLIGWWLLRVRRILRQAAPVERPELLALLDRLHKDLGLRLPVRLRSLDSGKIFGPAVVGLLRPTIYIPLPIANDWPVEEIEPILLHELVHVKRGDLLVNWLQILAQAAWFFHPLVWLANGQIRKLREDICDDVAIRNLDTDRQRYTGNMLRVVKAMNRTPAGSLLMLGFTETQKSLTRRIVRIMSDTYRNHPRLTRVSVAALAILAAGGFALASGNSISHQEKQIKINMDEATFESKTLRQAARYHLDGSYEKAIAEYEKILGNITTTANINQTLEISQAELRKHDLYYACLNLSDSYAKTGREDKGRAIILFAVENFNFEDNYDKLNLAVSHCFINNIFMDLASQWARKICEMSNWQSVGALRKYALIAEKRGDFREAIDAERYMLQYLTGSPYTGSIEERDLFTQIAIASLTIASGDSAAGEQLYEELIDTSAGNADKLISVGVSMLWESHFIRINKPKTTSTLNDVIEWARNTIAVTPNPHQQARYLGLLAALLYEKGDTRGAVQSLERALALTPGNVELQKRLEKFKAVPNDPAIRDGQAQVQPKVKKVPAKITKDEEWFAKETLQQAHRYFSDGSYDKAIMEYERVLGTVTKEDMTIQTLGFSKQESRKRQFFSAYKYLSQAYVKTGREDKGREILIYAVNNFDFDDNYTKLYLAAQHCQYNDMYMDLALQWAREACEMSGWERVPALMLHANIAGKTGHYAATIDTWNRILQHPEGSLNAESKAHSDLIARSHIAILHIKSGNTDQGEKLIRELLDSSQEDKLVLTTLASTCLGEKTLLAQAVEWAHKAVDLSSENEHANSLHLYAALLFENGDIAGAVKAQGEAVELSPNNQRLKKDLEKYRAALASPTTPDAQAQTTPSQNGSLKPDADGDIPFNELEVAYNADPVNRTIALAYADKLSRIGRNTLALPIFEKLFAEETEPAAIAQLYGWLGRVYFATNQYDKAIELWKEALASGVLPDNFDNHSVMGTMAIAPHSKLYAYVELARHSQYLKNDAAYIEYCSKIPESAAGNLRYYQTTAWLPFAYLRQGDVERGREELHRLLKIYQDAPEYAHQYLVNLAVHCLEYREYLPDMLPAMNNLYNGIDKDDRKAPYITHYYAQLLMKNGQVDQARNILESRIALETNEPDLHRLQVFLAIADELSGNSRASDAKLTALAEEAQSNSNKLSVIVQACRQMHIRPRQTLEWAARLMTLAETDGQKASCVHRYASLLFENGDTGQAIKTMQDAVEQYPYLYQMHLDLERYRAAVH